MVNHGEEADMRRRYRHDAYREMPSASLPLGFRSLCLGICVVSLRSIHG